MNKNQIEKCIDNCINEIITRLCSPYTSLKNRDNLPKHEKECLKNS